MSPKQPNYKKMEIIATVILTFITGIISGYFSVAFALFSGLPAATALVCLEAGTIVGAFIGICFCLLTEVYVGWE